MRNLGGILFGIGIIGLFYSLTMDTTVFSGGASYDRIHNQGLLNDRLVYAIISSALLITGTIFVTAAHFIDPAPPKPPTTPQPVEGPPSEFV